MAFTTWNPADKSANITLSNGDLTASTTSSNSSLRSIDPVPAGSKIYLELTSTAGGTNSAFGPANATHSLASLIGTDFNDDAVGLRGTDGSVFSLNVNVNSGYASNWITSSTVVGMAWDMVLGAIWFSLDGVWQDGATIGEIEAGTTTNAAYVDPLLQNSMFIGGSINNATITANFGATAFAGTVPTGFLAGLDIVTVHAGVGQSDGTSTSTADGTVIAGPVLGDGVTAGLSTTSGDLTQTGLAPGNGLSSGTSTTDGNLTQKLPAAGIGTSAGTSQTFGFPTLDNVNVDLSVEYDIRYTLTLTGAPNSLPDITLPMSAFQSRMRTDGTSFLQCTIPNAIMFIDAIAARNLGEIIITRTNKILGIVGDATLEVARAPFTQQNLSQGAERSTIQISGSSTFTSSGAKQVTVFQATFKSFDRLRVVPNGQILPGDVVVYENESLNVSDVAYSVSSDFSSMELTVG